MYGDSSCCALQVELERGYCSPVLLCAEWPSSLKIESKAALEWSLSGQGTVLFFTVWELMTGASLISNISNQYLTHILPTQTALQLLVILSWPPGARVIAVCPEDRLENKSLKREKIIWLKTWRSQGNHKIAKLNILEPNLLSFEFKYFNWARHGWCVK